VWQWGTRSAHIFFSAAGFIALERASLMLVVIAFVLTVTRIALFAGLPWSLEPHLDQSILVVVAFVLTVVHDKCVMLIYWEPRVCLLQKIWSPRSYHPNRITCPGSWSWHLHFLNPRGDDKLHPRCSLPRLIPSHASLSHRGATK
jgi:hypothetical protein